jgi:hypothetical protein
MIEPPMLIYRRHYAGADRVAMRQVSVERVPGNREGHALVAHRDFGA